MSSCATECKKGVHNKNPLSMIKNVDLVGEYINMVFSGKYIHIMACVMLIWNWVFHFYADKILEHQNNCNSYSSQDKCFTLQMDN